MKAIFLTVISLMLVLASCSKHNDEIITPQQRDTWSFNAAAYHAAKSMREISSGTSDIIFVQADTRAHPPNLTFRFTKFPKVSTTYKVVSYPRSDDEVSIYYLVGDDISGGDYSSDVSDGAHLEVKVINGKLSFYSDRMVIHGSIYIGAKYERADLAFNLTEF